MDALKLLSHNNQNVKICMCGGPDMILRISFIKFLISQGYEVTVVSSNEKEKIKFSEENIPCQFYPLNRKFSVVGDLKSFFILYNIFRQEKFTIVHAFDTKPTILGRIAAKFAKVPIIIGTIPGLGSVFSEETIFNLILRKIYFLLQRIACGISTLTIFQNQDDRDLFVKARITSISKTAIVRGSGIDTENFSPENVNIESVERIKKELCITSDNVVISMITRLVRYKGIKEFLEAARIIKRKYSDVIFLLIGPKDDTLSAFPIEELQKYSDVVKYLGPINDIKEILFLSDIVVLPSYYREGIPRAILEGASMGKPIITTDLPGCKEVVDEGINGFLIPPKNPEVLAKAIEKLILDKELRKKMGELSRKKVVKEFDSKIVFRELINIYSNLLKKSEIIL